MTPNKSEIIEEFTFLDLKKLKNKSESHHNIRPQSERIFNHRFDETNTDNSSDSEDEYRIQKMLR